jgi:hypothetical protein
MLKPMVHQIDLVQEHLDLQIRILFDLDSLRHHTSTSGMSHEMNDETSSELSFVNRVPSHIVGKPEGLTYQHDDTWVLSHVQYAWLLRQLAINQPTFMFLISRGFRFLSFNQKIGKVNLHEHTAILSLSIPARFWLRTEELTSMR